MQMNLFLEKKVRRNKLWKWQKSGVCSAWYFNGQKKYEEKYDTNGKYLQIEVWYKTGQLKQRKIYKNGQIHKITGWYKDGKNQHEFNFKN